MQADFEMGFLKFHAIVSSESGSVQRINKFIRNVRLKNLKKLLDNRIWHKYNDEVRDCALFYCAKMYIPNTLAAVSLTAAG